MHDGYFIIGKDKGNNAITIAVGSKVVSLETPTAPASRPVPAPRPATPQAALESAMLEIGRLKEEKRMLEAQVEQLKAAEAGRLKSSQFSLC